VIKINLAPIDELESGYWYLPEVIMIVLAVALSYYGIQTYLDGIRAEVEQMTTLTATKETALQEITRETAKYDQLDQNIVKLNEKLEALKKITVSKIARFKPVILLEHLQNLKPEGIWFNYVTDLTDDNKMTVVGKSFDNILVAEFMTAVAATKTQEMDDSDLRTQVYFDDVKLERISTTGASSANTIVTRRRAKPGEAPIVPEAPIENVSEHWSSTDKFFPELQKFPSFHLTLQYKERVPRPKVAQIITN
jgi:hypothetical protein